jgi:hypothetical protein
MSHLLHVRRQSSWAGCGSLLVLFLACAGVHTAWAAAGTEQFKYDALGRLTQVTFADGKTLNYGYDKAGNRTISGPTPVGPPGTFTKTAGTSPGGTVGPGSITIQNTGTGAISNVVISLAFVGQAGCSANPASYASLAPGQSVTFTWYKASAATFNCTPMATGSNASTSPVQWSM